MFQEHVFDKTSIVYHSEPGRYPFENTGGFWLRVKDGGRQDGDDWNQPLALDMRHYPQSYTRAAAVLYRRLKRAGYLTPNQTFLFVTTAKTRFLTNREFGRYGHHVARTTSGFYFSRCLTQVTREEMQIVHHAAGVFDFLVPVGGCMTFKEWGRAIVDHYDNSKGQAVAELLIDINRR